MRRLLRYACDGLNAFGLHDARVREAALEGRDLLWTLEDGNALPQWPANPHGRAMRVPKLSLRLREYEVQRLLVWSLERRGPESGILQYLPQDLPPEAWRDALLGANEVLFATAREEAGALLVELGFFIAGGGPYSEATLACSSVRLEWETFPGLAWFEERRAPDAQ